MAAPQAVTTGGVVIFGRQQLDAAGSLVIAGEPAGPGQRVYEVRDAMLGFDAESGADFSIRWRDAMVFEMGLDEYHAFLLARRKRLHGKDLP